MPIAPPSFKQSSVPPAHQSEGVEEAAVLLGPGGLHVPLPRRRHPWPCGLHVWERNGDSRAKNLMTSGVSLRIASLGSPGTSPAHSGNRSAGSPEPQRLARHDGGLHAAQAVCGPHVTALAHLPAVLQVRDARSGSPLPSGVAAAAAAAAAAAVHLPSLPSWLLPWQAGGHPV